MNERIDWIDIYKALAIALVVIGHTSSPLAPYIYLFHMPAFFFISGYVFRFDPNFYRFLSKRTRTLILPYLSFNAFFIALHSIFLTFHYESLFFKATKFKAFFIQSLNALLTFTYSEPLGGPTWFLVVLFETNLLCWIILYYQNRYQLRDYMIVVLMIFFITLGYLLVANHLTLNYYIDLVFFAIFFFLLGLLFKKYALFSKKAFIFATPIYCVFLDLVSIHQRVLIAFPTRTFGKWYIVILSSISGIMVLYVSSILLAKIKYINRFLIYIGNNTLSIFCLHFFIFKLLYVVYYLIGVIPISHLQELFPPDNVHWLPFSLLAIALSLGINYWIQKSGALSYLFLGQSKKG